MTNRLGTGVLGTSGDRTPASLDLALTMSCHPTIVGGAPDEKLAIAEDAWRPTGIRVVRLPSGGTKTIGAVVHCSLRSWRHPERAFAREGSPPDSSG